jgi:hypothetical protein
MPPTAQHHLSTEGEMELQPLPLQLDAAMRAERGMGGGSHGHKLVTSGAATAHSRVRAALQ